MSSRFTERPSLPWYRWFCADWLSSETRLGMDLAARGVYRDLLDYHYQEGSIPAEPAVLARFLGVGMDEFGAAWKQVGPSSSRTRSWRHGLSTGERPKRLRQLKSSAESRRRTGSVAGVPARESQGNPNESQK